MKKYEITTIKDIVTIINDKNIDCFIKDFEQFLRMAIESKKATGIMRFFVTDRFAWIDDGKTGLTAIRIYKSKDHKNI